MALNEDMFVKCDLHDVNLIEKGVRNKWLWSWLEFKDSNGDYLGSYIRKLHSAGKAICIICRRGQGKLINYGEGGVKVLKQHAASNTHKKGRELLKNSRLPLPSSMEHAKALETATPGLAKLIKVSEDLLPYTGVSELVKDNGDSAAVPMQGVSNKRKRMRSAEVTPRTSEETPQTQSQDQRQIVNDQFDFLHRNDLLEPKIEMNVDTSEHSASVPDEEGQSLHPLAVLQNIAHEEAFSQEQFPTNKMPSCKKEKVVEETGGNLDLLPTSTNNDERHMLFFRSILLSLRPLDEEQTLEFHMGVLKLLQDIRKQNSASSADDNSRAGPQPSYLSSNHHLASVKHFTTATTGNPQNKQN